MGNHFTALSSLHLYPHSVRDWLKSRWGRTSIILMYKVLMRNLLGTEVIRFPSAICQLAFLSFWHKHQKGLTSDRISGVIWLLTEVKLRVPSRERKDGLGKAFSKAINISLKCVWVYLERWEELGHLFKESENCRGE